MGRARYPGLSDAGGHCFGPSITRQYFRSYTRAGNGSARPLARGHGLVHRLRYRRPVGPYSTQGWVAWPDSGLAVEPQGAVGGYGLVKECFPVVAFG